MDINEIRRPADMVRITTPELADAYIEEQVKLIREQMREAAASLEFEEAAKLRDELFALTGEAPSDSSKSSGGKAKPGMPGSRRKARGRTRK